MKHLNPRQGITTPEVAASFRRSGEECETPKSPPGDYNNASCVPGFNQILPLYV